MSVIATTSKHADTGWLVTQFYCPFCGKQEIEAGGMETVDYYLGGRYRCRACRSECYLDNGYQAMGLEGEADVRDRDD